MLHCQGLFEMTTDLWMWVSSPFRSKDPAVIKQKETDKAAEEEAHNYWEVDWERTPLWKCFLKYQKQFVFGGAPFPAGDFPKDVSAFNLGFIFYAIFQILLLIVLCFFIYLEGEADSFEDKQKYQAIVQIGCLPYLITLLIWVFYGFWHGVSRFLFKNLGFFSFIFCLIYLIASAIVIVIGCVFFYRFSWSNFLGKLFKKEEISEERRQSRKKIGEALEGAKRNNTFSQQGGGGGFESQF